MDIKQQIAERITKANNILVTVSANPSVDQLAACIGLTLLCNKLGKHATAVFSGNVPSIIEFLQPEKTLEKNTDSLRDFIIALDKSKADKLRYKVEDKVVKIFITPYRTSIGEKDLNFSQGDFNVDVIVALGVHSQTDLDQAITAHGRILHDAAIVTLNVAPGGELGGVNWLEPAASSLSELAAELAEEIDMKLVDGQIATAFLTGIVAETERFSNARTSPETMSISAELMSQGANQQLVASKLEAPAPLPTTPAPVQKPVDQPAPGKPDDGTLEIEHDDKVEASEGGPTPQIHIDEHGEIKAIADAVSGKPEPKIEAPAAGPAVIPAPVASLPPELPEPRHIPGPKFISEPPTFANELKTGLTAEDTERPSGSPLSLPSVEPQVPLLRRTPLTTAEPPLPTSAPVFPDAPLTSAGSAPFSPTPAFSPAPTLAPAPTPEPMNPPLANSAAPTLVESTASPLTPPSSFPPLAPEETLSQIERDVHSSHVDPVQSFPLASSLPSSPVAPLSPPAFSSLNPTSPLPEPTQSVPAPSATPAFSLPEPPAPSVAAPVSSAPFAPANPFTAPMSAPAPAAPVAPWTPPAETVPAPPDPSLNLPSPASPSEDATLPNVSAARDAVASAISQGSAPAEPIQALNAQDLGGPLHEHEDEGPSLSGGIDPNSPPPMPPPMVSPAA